MRDYMSGWKNKDEVWIPPLEQSGFQESVIRRKPIEPIFTPCVQEEKREDSSEKNINDEEATVLINTKIDRTVLVKRMSTEEVMEITTEEFVIGKSSTADWVISDNPTISRRHARIFWNEGEFYLEDMNSSNHSYLEERQITEPVKLGNGVVFSLAEEKFCILL